MQSLNGLAVLVLVLAIADPSRAIMQLRGVAIENPPFVIYNNGKFEGLCVDIIDEVAKIVKFNYTLYLVPDGKYGSPDKGTAPSGLVKEMWDKRANFTVADLAINLARQVYMNFTEPYLTTHLSALIQKQYKGNIKNFQDLLNQRDVEYGMARRGQTNSFRHQAAIADVNTLNQIFQRVFSHENLMTESAEEGVRRASTSKYAFIQEAIDNDYAIDQSPRCDLTAIQGEQNDRRLRLEFAIGLQKDSPLTKSFNDAVRQLRNTGVIIELKKKYLNQWCRNQDNPRPHPEPQYPTARPTPKPIRGSANYSGSSMLIIGLMFTLLSYFR